MTEEENTIDLSQLGSAEPFIEPLSREISLYLSDELKSPSAYTQWFHLIRKASPNDVIKIHINSPGGNVNTAMQFIRVLGESEATIVASVEGLCASAATMVFLAADMIEITPHSVFMFHNYSGGTFGKGEEMYQQVTHMKKWSEGLLRSVYKDFLTDTEITSILNNQDIWMSAEEVAKRVEKKIKAAKRKKISDD